MGISRDNRGPPGLIINNENVNSWATNGAIEPFTENQIGFHSWFVEFANVVSNTFNWSFAHSLAFVVARYGGMNHVTFEEEEAMRTVISDDVPHAIFLNALLLVHSNYVSVSNNAYRMEMERLDINRDMSLILGGLAFATMGDSLHARLNGSSIREAVLMQVTRMLVTLRQRGSHPAVDGTTYPTPEGFPDVPEISDDEGSDDEDDDRSSSVDSAPVQ